MHFSRCVLALLVSVLTLGAASSALASAAVEADYSIVARWNVGGAGGWDYLTFDAAGNRLFITRAERVDVLDVKTGTIVGHIPETHGVHGVALAQDLKRGYTSNGKGNSITEFDLETLAAIRTVPITGDDPDTILYVAASRQLLTFNGHSHDISVFDAKTLAPVTTLKVPGTPEFGADDGAGHVFLNIESEPGQIVRIDMKALKVTDVWTTPGCDSPSGLALDSAQQHLFSVCDHKVMAITDARTGRQVAKVAIGLGPDAAAVDPATGLAFSSNRDGTLTIVGRDAGGHYKVLQSLATQLGARTMAYDPATRRVYLVTSEFGATPAATPEHPKPRPELKPGTFTVLVAAPH